MSGVDTKHKGKVQVSGLAGRPLPSFSLIKENPAEGAWSAYCNDFERVSDFAIFSIPLEIPYSHSSSPYPTLPLPPYPSPASLPFPSLPTLPLPPTPLCFCLFFSGIAHYATEYNSHCCTLLKKHIYLIEIEEENSSNIFLITVNESL